MKMAGEQKVRVDGGMGVLWCIGWLFTIGYLKLSFWIGVLAVILWPYYLGTALR